MDFDSEKIRREADRWFARRRDGTRPPADEAEFQRWLAQGQAHADAYRASEHAWQELAELEASSRLREMTAAAMQATSAASRRETSRSRWKPLLLVAGIAALAVIGTLRLLPLADPPVVAVYQTELGEQRTEQLPDGSRVILNTDTVLRMTYRDARRDILLQQGEAMFDVATDPERPFVVAAANGTVTALGTRFQVRDDSGAVSVTLIEGKVAVAREAERRILTPGDRAAYAAASPGIAVRQVDTSAAMGWTQGRLDFQGIPLAEAVAEANRYSAQKLQLGDPALATIPVSGSFKTGDNSGIAAAFAAVFSMRIARTTDTAIVLMPAGPENQ